MGFSGYTPMLRLELPLLQSLVLSFWVSGGMCDIGIRVCGCLGFLRVRYVVVLRRDVALVAVCVLSSLLAYTR